MIDGYPRQPSVLPGATLTLHVSTDAPAFQVAFYRQAETLRFMARSPWHPGRHVSPGLPHQDWGWPGYAFPIPATWPSGAYVAVLVERSAAEPSTSDAPLPSADARTGRALFVVRGARPGAAARILYKLPLATYHAYNASGGGSLYVTSRVEAHTGRSMVTLRRPGGGTGSALSFPEAVDVYDPATPREGFAHWDAPFIAWLARNGYAVDFCTDLDLHAEPDLPRPYALLLSVGHDEYWTEAMRDHAERFVAAGGNVAFFGGNTCWWRVHLVQDGTALACVHPPYDDPASDQWWHVRAENGLTGVSYRGAGGWWSGERDAVGYTVQHAGHWLYEGTGLRDGDVLGAEQHLVGYECDGAAFETPHPALAVPTGADGTPADFTILGTARLGPGWQDRPRGDNAAATLGIREARGGCVFTCATTDWARVLHGGEPRVEQITRTVLDHLSVPGVRVLGPARAWCGAPVAVEGEEASFHVDPAGLAEPGAGTERRYEWRVAGGEPLQADGGPVCRVRVGPAPGLVTASVRAWDGSALGAFGARTARVLSTREARQVEMLCRLRELLQAAEPALRATEPPGPGNWPLSDPRWDAVRDGLRALLRGDSLAAAGEAHRAVAAAIERLRALDAPEPGAAAGA